MGATSPRREPPRGITAPEIAVLAPDDAPAGLALSDEAGWNQALADWEHFLRRGTVYGARDEAGRVVGTAALLPYDPAAGGDAAAWVSLVLVAPAHRGRGLATALTGRCLDEARRLGRQARLDATPAGAAVYQNLGFAPGDDLVRLRRPPLQARTGPAAPATAGDLDAFLALDRRATGLDRGDLFRAIAARPGSHLRGGDGAACLVRDGRRARQVGPLHAVSDAAALDLLEAVLAREPGELVIDLVAEREAVRTALFKRGFALERPFTRMALGRAAPLPALAVAGAGPEYG